MSNANKQCLTVNLWLVYSIAQRQSEFLLQISEDIRVDCARAGLCFQGFPAKHYFNLHGPHLPHYSTGKFRHFDTLLFLMNSFTCLGCN